MEMFENDVCLGETPMAGEIRFWEFAPTAEGWDAKTVCSPAKLRPDKVLEKTMIALGYPRYTAASLFKRDPYLPEGEQRGDLAWAGWLGREAR